MITMNVANQEDARKSRLLVKDKLGRVLLQISPEGKIAIARFPDMSVTGQNKLLGICKAIIQDNSDVTADLEKIRKFISFESDDDEFCS